MATLTVCDRCGDRIKGTDALEVLKLERRGQNPTEFIPTELDLCPSCAASVRRFVTEPPSRAA